MRKSKKMRIPTINWPHIELSFQKHAHSNSPKTKRSNAIYPTRPFFGSWILFLRKNIKKTNPPLVAFFLRVLIMARPAPNLAAKTWLIMCQWAGQKERLHMLSRNWAAIMMQNQFYKSRVLPMNHIRLETLATNQNKVPKRILALTNLWAPSTIKFLSEIGHQNKKSEFQGLTPSYPAWQAEFAVLHHFFGANLCQQIQNLTPKDPEKYLWNTCEIHSSQISVTVIIVYG